MKRQHKDRKADLQRDFERDPQGRRRARKKERAESMIRLNDDGAESSYLSKA